MKDYVATNVLALGEVFLENNSEKLKDKDVLVVRLHDADNIKEEIQIEKNNLPNELKNVFEKGVDDLTKISVNYYENKILTELTSIEIFKSL